MVPSLGIFSVIDIINSLSPHSGIDIWDLLTERDIWAKVREKAVQQFKTSNGSKTLVLDLSQIKYFDWSIAEELISRLIIRLDEFSTKYVVVESYKEDHKRQIHDALERRKLAIIAYNRDGDGEYEWSLLGKSTAAIRNTLEILMSQGHITSEQLAEMGEFQQSSLATQRKHSASERLGVLQKLHLVHRERQSLSEGGKGYVYFPIIKASVYSNVAS